MLSIFPAVVIILTSLTNLPAQSVVGNYIAENPPGVANDVTKEFPIRMRADLEPISIEMEETILYVEDLIAGRINSSSDLPEYMFETSSRAPVSKEGPKAENLPAGMEGNGCQSNCKPDSSVKDAKTERPTAEPVADSGLDDSPCSDIFFYKRSAVVKGRWYGELLVYTNVTVTGVKIEITLDKPAQSFGAWLGEVSSTDNILFIIFNGEKKIAPGPPLSVRFFVKYSKEEVNPPRIKAIMLNGRQICPMEAGSSPPLPEPPTPRSEPVTVRTTVTTPISIVGLLNYVTPVTIQESVATIRDGIPALPVSPARPVPSPKPPVTKQNGESTEIVDGVQCGQVEVQPSPFVFYGQYTARGQWPWHVALYKSTGRDLSYMCGGSLIGKKTILTAAHCVGRPYNNRRVDPERLVVYLGKHNLNLWSEGGVQTKQIREVYVHPDYNSTDFHADIAILELISPVEFTFYIKPVCLWDRNRIELSEVEGLEGAVIGWHYDEKEMINEELMMAKMHVLPQQTCYQQFFSRFISNETYCASIRNGDNVCNGDSGGGMVFPKRNRPGSPETWVLRGIVSFGTLLDGRRVCNAKYFVVFTDVAKYLDWIQKYQ